MQPWQIKALELETSGLKHLALLIWVLSGGLRRKFPSQPNVRAGIGIFIQPHAPLPPIIINEYDRSGGDPD
jgi:hypothetical protein